MKKICIIGLGYVGLPLALEFGKKFDVIGFDTNKHRIKQLNAGLDITKEVSKHELQRCKKIEFVSSSRTLHSCNIFIITVPTPITKNNLPDLSPLIKASELVAELLKAEDIVIYESTVFPGCTEEVCVPILEKESGLIYNKDFFCGYSPERINPGDPTRKLPNITKVVSGSTPKISKLIYDLYAEIILAGVHLATSIKVAEAAKVIENTQRDLNIALMNELSCIFEKLGIKTSDVLAAASTKWNFLDFKPGLVGGHCIGVDPYYLTYKAKQIGHIPKVILSGREINDSMSTEVVRRIKKSCAEKSISISNANILIMGFTFKENCPDIRNSKVLDLATTLLKLKAKVSVFDPVLDLKQVRSEIPLKFLNQFPASSKYDILIYAVNHKLFKKLKNQDYVKILKNNNVIFTIKGNIPGLQSDGEL
jgi:UDP-N-acetyl-D-glucosamine/UDP-N-acetyl-D-galactosamine dehydrogenase